MVKKLCLICEFKKTKISCLCMRCYKERDALVDTLWKSEKYTNNELGKIFGITGVRIRQIIHKNERNRRMLNFRENK